MDSVLIAGDTLDFATTVALYPANEGWTLVYRLIPQAAGPAVIGPLTATTFEGTRYRLQVGPLVTASWTPSTYSWAATVEKVGARYTVDGWISDDERLGSGKQVIVKPDPATVTSYDNRSPAKKLLDQMNADVLAAASSGGVNTGRVVEYTIGNRSMRFESTSTDEFKAAHAAAKYDVWCEEERARLAEGHRSRRNVSMRFGRA